MTGDLLEDLLNGEEEEKSLLDEESEKLAPLQEEIDSIYNLEIRSFVRAVLYYADAFWQAPSTNIEGFHPPDELALGGSILHTQRVVRIARILCRSQDRTQHEFDIVTAAALLHDITKSLQVDGEYSFDSMHPYTVDYFVSTVLVNDEKYNTGQLSYAREIKDDDCALILRLIRCHMGPWSPIPETYPVSQLDWILHFADVVATQLHLIIDGEDVKKWRWIESKPKRRSKVPQKDIPSE